MIDARVVKRFPSAPEAGAFELNIHLRAEDGVTALLGPSGAGKTLTLNCLGGFTRPDEGRIMIDDEIYFDAGSRVNVPPEERRCGYLFQDHALFPHMTIRENLHFAGVSRSPKSRGIKLHRHINDLLDAFELADLAARKPAQLSGGQKQRAALARILVSEARLLLLDEPTRGLDARLRQGFYDVLRKTRDRLRAPVLLVTHDLEECFELADFVCLMERGRFLQTGPRNTVLCKPATTEVARALGIYNIIPAVITHLDPSRNISRLRILNHDFEGVYLPAHLIGDKGFVCVRESDVRILPPDLRGTENQMVLRVIESGACSHGVRIRLENDLAGIVSSYDFEALRGNNQLRVEIPRSAVYFLGR